MHALVVEDDPSLQTLVEMTLQLVGGWQVTVAASGEEALRLAPGLALDVMLIDMMMPGLDGLATLGRLRELGIETPAIFMTAKVRPHELEAYAAAGALTTIAKPYDPMTLPATIEAALAGQRAS